jgi:hypothetical protein
MQSNSSTTVQPRSRWIHSLRTWHCAACGHYITAGEWFLHFENGKDACIVCALGPEGIGPSLPVAASLAEVAA